MTPRARYPGIVPLRAAFAWLGPAPALGQPGGGPPPGPGSPPINIGGPTIQAQQAAVLQFLNSL